MHFLASLFFLLLIMVLTSLYIAAGYFFILIVGRLGKHIWRKIRKGAKEGAPNSLSLKALVKPNIRKKAFLSLIAFFIVVHLFVYTSQRSKWMGKDNANLEAKEYYVAGQVLQGFRTILTTFIHPEIPIILPANRLQKVIYNTGVRYLPKDDGEIAVWQNGWFHYHYHKRGRRPLFVVNWEPSDKMVKMLDKWWFCLETMATKPFADKKMETEHYYRDYPSLAMSYTLQKGFYAGKLIASAHKLAQMPVHQKRAQLLSTWLWELKEKWSSSQEMNNFLEKEPKLEALMQFVLLSELEGFIHAEIYRRTLGCENISVQRYVRIRHEFAGPDNGLPAYLRMRSQVQGQRLYRMAINSAGPRSIQYVLKHFCGIQLAGKVDYSYWESWAKRRNMTAQELAEDASKSNFHDEIKILEELYNG